MLKNTKLINKINMVENTSACDGTGVKKGARDTSARERDGVSAGVWVACYRVTLSFPQGLLLSNFAGFALHGVWGATLREVSPVAYRTLYGDDDIVHPWLITPLAPHLAPGSVASFELRLFSEATRFLPDLIGALMLAGCAGLGVDRSPFDVQAVDVLLPGERGAQRLDLAEGGHRNPSR
jgi:hypothetical protein